MIFKSLNYFIGGKVIVFIHKNSIFAKLFKTSLTI